MFFSYRYPRLVTLSHKVLFDNPPPQPQFCRDGCALVLQWCSEDISESEGISLVKMLSSMKYAQITSILNAVKFNMSILQYCFRYMRRCYQLVRLVILITSYLVTNH